MKLDDIRVSGKPLVKVKAAEVDELASRWWITFPKGYREYVTKFGEGVLGGSLVRIYPPWRIEKELVGWRRRIGKYWFWDAGEKVLPKERALECVIIGDTTNGDELVFHPTRPNMLFVLPHDSERVFEAGDDLLTAIEWMCGSGELVDPFEERNFEPFDSRLETEQVEGIDKVVDLEGESLDDIVELGKRWVARHSAKKQAVKETKGYIPKGGKSKLVYEAIILNAGSSLDVGYGIEWKIIGTDGESVVGTLQWQKNDDSYGSRFDPANKE